MSMTTTPTISRAQPSAPATPRITQPATRPATTTAAQAPANPGHKGSLLNVLV